MPPTPPRSIDENENMLAPQRSGIKLPMVEPIVSPIQTSGFVCMK